ncbi:uroporphyrinogen-III synthase [Roseicyclus marinus]|uniref:uroporphyrinogen-III synthase n=1 Tax=Roseicyclus marinus TaxID=2161673 RepID=UPI00240F61CA|nr:uroporphyrinogen-III synthase [Roseicyclus marinus]MDG3041245.1 uroporphyrinogen-III synthase [Roseicyclus marinus]
MSDNAAPLVILTRPRAASERFVEALRADVGPVAVTILPLMDMAPLVDSLDLDGVAALIFTSAAGVETFAGLTDDRSLNAWCVGDRTAEAARDIGLKATSAGGDAEALIALMAEARPEGRLLHLHGAHVSVDVADRLAQHGLRAEGLAIYDQVSVPPGDAMAAALAHDGPILVPLFSPRSARLFVEAAGQAADRIQPVVISIATRDALPDALAQRATVADTPDAPAMIRALSSLISS